MSHKVPARYGDEEVVAVASLGREAGLDAWSLELVQPSSWLGSSVASV